LRRESGLVVMGRLDDGVSLIGRETSDNQERDDWRSDAGKVTRGL